MRTTEIPEDVKNQFEDEEYKAVPLENFRKSIVTTVAYLIGVDDKNLNQSYDAVTLETLRSNDDAETIRLLCKLRTQFFKNYIKIQEETNRYYRKIEDLAELLDLDAIKKLSEKGIEIATVSEKKNIAINISYINQYVLERIDRVKNVFPDWVKFNYIRSLFLIKGAYAGSAGELIKHNQHQIIGKIMDASKYYAAHKNSYPYSIYLNWPCRFKENDGNVLLNDLKFLQKLYSAFEDKFQFKKYVVDAKKEYKDDIKKFIDDASSVAIYVDCENVDPYAFVATLKGLDGYLVSKIKAINLYDDNNAPIAWDYISDTFDSVEVNSINTERVLGNKSVVDTCMTLGVTKGYYENNYSSAILVSSDSDFWPLIDAMKNTEFYVLNEQGKTSSAVIDKMDQNGVHHCYMNYFAQDNSLNFKEEVLLRGLEQKFSNFYNEGYFSPMDVDELIEELFHDAGIKGDQKQLEDEKNTFYNKYLKDGFVMKPIMCDDKRKFKLEIKSKIVGKR